MLRPLVSLGALSLNFEHAVKDGLVIEFLNRARTFLRARIGKDRYDAFMRQKRKEARYKTKVARRHAKFDSFILSYPNSGRTWHGVMLGFYLARVTGSADSEALLLDALCQRAGLPLVLYSHNGTNHGALFHASNPCVAAVDQWRARKVMLLVREPKAVLVSAFHHTRFRSKDFSGGLPEFIRDPRFGIDKVVTAYQRWHANRHQASTFSVVSYEEMHARPEDVLHRTVALIGLTPDKAIISEAVRLGRFENMKQYESTDFFNHPDMRVERADNPDKASKVREGKTDAYKSHLTQDDIAYIDRRIAGLGGNPFVAQCALTPS